MAGQAGTSCTNSDFYAEDALFQIRPGHRLSCAYMFFLSPSERVTGFIHSSVVLQTFVGPWAILSFLIYYTVGRTPRTGDQSIRRPLPSHRTAQAQNKRTQTSMPQVKFEPTVPVFERAKTFHALDRAVTVICRMTG
jgi:hypothetical protein